MAQHCGYIVKVEKIRPHTNADRLQIAEFFGCETCVSLDVTVGDIGVYFPSGLQLSEEMCAANDLVRRKDENGNPTGGFLEPDKRNIKTIRLRGEVSDGLYLPIKALEFTGVKTDKLSVGTTIDILNGVEICRKYIPKVSRQAKINTPSIKDNKKKKKKPVLAPLFIEHADTNQLAFNINCFKPGDEVELTLKIHGTSARTAFLPVFKKYKRTLWDVITRKDGKPVYEWDYISGSRRKVLEKYDGGFYDDDGFRKRHHDFFVGKLRKGEEVYYEIAGFTDAGVPIMGNANNKKVKDEEFVKKYGNTTQFSYGCDFDDPNLPNSDIWVYRMTMTNEDGDVVEYSPDFMRYRCEQMGVKTVPVFEKFIMTEDTDIVAKVENYYDGPDPIGKTHIREGVVARIVNRPTFIAFKHKNFYFKVLSGIAIENVDTQALGDDVLSEM